MSNKDTKTCQNSEAEQYYSHRAAEYAKGIYTTGKEYFSDTYAP